MGALDTDEGAPVALPTARSHPFDPPTELAKLRERGDPCRLRYPDGDVGWLVTSHELARALLADPRFSVRPPKPPVGDPTQNAAVIADSETRPEFRGVVMNLDPPEHTALRRLQTGFFTVRRVEEHRSVIERIVETRLDAMEQAGKPLDLVEVYSLPLASMTICELLGVPSDDRHEFERPTEVNQDPAASAGAKIAARDDFIAYARGVIATKRAYPGDDLLSALAARDELAEDELAGVALQLFSAGHETTANMLSLSVLVLLFEPSRWEQLRNAGDETLASAVEELLRYLTIVQTGAFTRTAIDDVHVGRVQIRRGESVVVSLSAANRDPRKFSDPDHFDFSRDAGGHLAFGHGRHMCLGQHLARLEMEVGLRGLLDRFPTLCFEAPVDEISLYDGERQLYGVEKLPVAW